MRPLIWSQCLFGCCINGEISYSADHVPSKLCRTFREQPKQDQVRRLRVDEQSPGSKLWSAQSSDLERRRSLPQRSNVVLLPSKPSQRDWRQWEASLEARTRCGCVLEQVGSVHDSRSLSGDEMSRTTVLQSDWSSSG